MKKVGMISVTLNAVNPMMAVLQSEDALQVQNYLDEGLQEMVRKEGGITHNSIARMTALVGNALRDEAEIILLTCTVFTPYLNRLQNLFSVPFVSADGAMLEEAAGMNKKTAVLCTFPATLESSATVFAEAAARLGSNVKPDFFLLEEAASAIKKGDASRHNRLIADRTNQLGREYEVVVLAQISMSPAASLLSDAPFTVLTSPQSALKSLLAHSHSESE
jgi:hypothetical protein